MEKRCRSLMLSVLALVGALSCQNSPLALGSSPTSIVFTIPEGYPTEMPVLLQGHLEGDAGEESVFVFSNPCNRYRCVTAQRDRSTGELLCFLPVSSPNLQGESLCFAVRPACCLNRRVTIETQDQGMQFFDCGRPVFFYQKEPNSLDDGKHVSANYVHPLLGLDGETLTQDFPKDHPHHHGVFWAWHQLWVGEKRAGDAWADQDFLPVVKDARVLEEGPLFATLQVLVDWTSPLLQDDSGKAIPFVEEETSIRLYSSVADFQYIDFTVTLTALLDGVQIGGSENVKGYSGFTVRLKPPKDIAITNDSERLAEDAVGAPSRWVDVVGQYENGDTVSGVGILTHPTMPEFPPRWLFRHYGPQNVSYPGRHPVPLPKGQPLTLRHRIVLHRGDTEQARISEHQMIFEASGVASNQAAASR